MDFPGGDRLEPEVLYEDACLVAVYKPPRMHCAPGLGAGDLCAWAFARHPELERAGEGLTSRGRSPAEGGLLHRLDYETSGIVLFARTPEAFGSLLRQQGSGGFHKEYLAFSSVSRGAFPEGSLPLVGCPGGVAEGAWSAAREGMDGRALASLLGGEGGPRKSVSCSFRSFGPKGARVACLGPGTEARGEPGPIYSSEMLGCSALPASIELRVGLARGFRHQIRAQLAWIGLPILGDSLYGGAPDGRLRLYAVRLSFGHPATGEAVSLSL